jgi:uncharacterized membrane protein SpoIIM required for sporulation
MKEIVFIERNTNRWKEFESVINSKSNISPDKVSELFMQITDDLAYSRTYYPGSQVTSYLNGLAVSVHHKIYKNKKVKRSRFAEFWMVEYPLLIKANMRYIVYSLLVFLVAFAIGLLSAANDSEFTRLIMGDSYVNMTLENMQKGDPMAVYKQTNSTGMFLQITINNIYVAFRAVVFGIFLSIGTGYMLLSNGIMVGAFQFMFYQHGFLKESILTVYIHGTFELFSIVIAGAAGFIIGSGIMFPGNYKRIESFTNAIKRAMRIVIGIVPLFIVAAFLEGFVTRLTYWPTAARASIIGVSLLIIIFYFFIYPNLLAKKLLNDGNEKN